MNISGVRQKKRALRERGYYIAQIALTKGVQVEVIDIIFAEVDTCELAYILLKMKIQSKGFSQIVHFIHISKESYHHIKCRVRALVGSK
ncbi:MAG: hypothetical protein WAS72_05895 [Saprospiraceae bacterium]